MKTRRIAHTLLLLALAGLGTNGCAADAEPLLDAGDPAMPCGEATVATAVTETGSMVAFCAIEHEAGTIDTVIELVPPGVDPALDHDVSAEPECGLRTFVRLTDVDTPIPQALVDSCEESVELAQLIGGREVVAEPVLLAPEPTEGAAEQPAEEQDSPGMDTQYWHTQLQGDCALSAAEWQSQRCFWDDTSCRSSPQYWQSWETSWASNSDINVTSCNGNTYVGVAAAVFGDWRLQFSFTVYEGYTAFAMQSGWIIEHGYHVVPWQGGANYRYRSDYSTF